MAKNNAWTDSLKKAKVAEDITRRVYEKLGWIVTDVRDNPQYQHEDIDFVCTWDQDKITVESKSDDTHQYGNFAFETVKNTNTGELGWALTTTADIITIYFPPIDLMYVLDGPKAVAWFMEHQHEFLEKTNHTARREGGVLYDSKFRTVSRDRLERESGAVLSKFHPLEYLKDKVS